MRIRVGSNEMKYALRDKLLKQKALKSFKDQNLAISVCTETSVSHQRIFRIFVVLLRLKEKNLHGKEIFDKKFSLSLKLIF